MTRSVRLICLVILLLSMFRTAEAGSLKVSPGRFLVHNIQPGRLYDIYKETGVRLTVYNDSNVSRTWVLSAHRPSERGRWEKGYGEIPDAQWCWFDKDEITVGPNSRAHANLYLEIPDEERYYNQHWVVTINVASRVGLGLALAVDVRVLIETRSRVGLKTKPSGLLGLEPCMIRFEDMVPGTSQKAQVALYNNDNTAHTYTMTSLFEGSDTKRNSYLTHTYTVIPDTSWIRRPEEKITIQPGECTTVNMELKIPGDEANFGRRWEDILLIQPDLGLAGFVRVQVETKKKAKAE